jgi:hypothetical protein
VWVCREIDRGEKLSGTCQQDGQATSGQSVRARAGAVSRCFSDSTGQMGLWNALVWCALC